ncbi:MAG: nucleotidyltransferase domain-containing protein [Nanoarchaeota archaeon]
MYKAYTSTFVSWYLAAHQNMKNVRCIILFGSAAKGEAKKDSDIDIFFDVHSATKKIQKEIEDAIESFYKSRDALIFKAKGVDNKINAIVGKLEEWNDLKQSIEASGIVLYGPYVGGRIEGRKYAVISWSRIGTNRGAFLNKIYGFRANDKKYQGLLEKLEGRKLGKSTIMVPVERKNDILPILKYHDVDATIQEGYF